MWGFHSILYLTDPESFTSLILVDHAWRAASQTPQLYAHHLSRCPSFCINNIVIDAGPFTDNSLPQLKQKFAEEVKRNLFEAYLRPRRTVVNLVSTTTGSSAAFPGGEAFEFSFSPNGHWVLALSSSRIYIVDTVSPKISVQRELKVLRRPVSAAILDDGSRLAVLSSDHHVNVYDLSDSKTKHLRSVSLDNPPHTIALAPKGEVLAVAFDGGVELHSLASNDLIPNRRTVKCDRVDALNFSGDGTMLLGTTRNSKNPNTVILTAPYYTEDNQDLPPSDQISHIWTSQIIFPNSSRDCSHAILLPNRSDGDASWSFTYDRVFESFRAVRTDDLRNGTTYFTGPNPPRREGSKTSRKKFTPCTLPASSSNGDLVAAGFSGKDVWLYSVPEGLDTSNVTLADEPNSQGSSSGPSTPSSDPKSPATSMTRGEAAELTRLPKWQVLVDKYRNVFAKGRRVAEIPGVSSLCWVSRKHERPAPYDLKERLIIAAPGGIAGDPELEQDDFASIDGGRLIILDFDRTAEDGKVEELTFEVGHVGPEILEEETVDMDTEVALARRRTIRKGVGIGANTVADVLASAPPIPRLAPTANAVANANQPSSSGAALAEAITIDQASGLDSDSPAEGLSLEEASEVFDGPYSHNQPRSRTSLYRSATAVAANRQRNPTRIIAEGHIEYRRPDGRGELPHESDADNWVPPPPPYAPNADRPLPDHLRRSLLPQSTGSGQRQRNHDERPRRASTMYGSTAMSSVSRRISSLPDRPSTRLPRSYSAHQAGRSISDSVFQSLGGVNSLSSPGVSFGDEISELPAASRRALPATTTRRPMSAYVGRLTGSLRRPAAARLSSPILPESIPPMPQRPAAGQSVSLPPSPTHNNRPSSPITLTGANLQQRLEYPVPPTPPAPATQVRDPFDSLAASMPSAQQLAQLSKRTRQAPPPQAARHMPPGIATSGYPVPAPPRGALGAAGSPTSSALLAPARSLSGRNAFARSSPALARPAARRLDTIESVSSFISRPRTRSRSRDLHRTASAAHRRSQSVGPALRLDRMPTDRLKRKKSFFRGKMTKKSKSKAQQYTGDGLAGNDPGKGTACMMM